MKAVKWLGIGVVAVIVVLVVVGFLLPSEVKVERSIVVTAPVAVVFDQVNDRAKHIQYSPWDDDDPTMKMSVSDPSVGEGAVYSWTSEKGPPGKVTIVKSVANERIEEKLEFADENPSKAWWTFEDGGDGVKVTHGFTADMGNNLVGRYFALGIDSMVGPKFETELEGLKTASEAAPVEDTAEDGTDEMPGDEMDADEPDADEATEG